MKLILKIKSGSIAMNKAMGATKVGKYYNSAGKVAMRIHGKNNYHFDYSVGKKAGSAPHSSYSKMTRGLKHQSEFQKQAKSSTGKVVKVRAGTHAEKRRDKKGKIVTRHVSNTPKKKPAVRGKKQQAGSIPNAPKPAPKQVGKQNSEIKIRSMTIGDYTKLKKQHGAKAVHAAMDAYNKKHRALSAEEIDAQESTSTSTKHKIGSLYHVAADKDDQWPRAIEVLGESNGKIAGHVHVYHPGTGDYKNLGFDEIDSKLVTSKPYKPTGKEVGDLNEAFSSSGVSKKVKSRKKNKKGK